MKRSSASTKKSSVVVLRKSTSAFASVKGARWQPGAGFYKSTGGVSVAPPESCNLPGQDLRISGSQDLRISGSQDPLLSSCALENKADATVEAEPQAPSLVNYVQVPTQASIRRWDKKQKRGYHRIQSCLQYWQSHDFQVLWVMLSTSTGGDPSKLAYDHQRLRQRIENRLDYPGIQHYQVRTAEGNGLLHIFWAWRARDGFRQRSFYVKQAWLSRQWQDIHGAKVVWIARVKRGRISRNKLSRYCISQYVADQSGYQYMSWSWGRTFGFPLVACWRWFKAIWSQYNGNSRKKVLYAFWGAFLSGKAIPLWRNRYTCMQIVSDRYRECSSLVWVV